MSKFNPFLVDVLKTNNEQYGLHVVDVGSSGGIDIPWGNMAGFSNTQCYGFEPCQAEFDHLKNQKNIHYFSTAISDEVGELDFYENGSVSSLSERTDRVHRFNEVYKARRVESDTLDNLRHSQLLPQVDVLKIDVEGNEERVLHGAKTTLLKETLYVKAEFSFEPGSGNCLSAMDEVLHEADFFLFELCTQKYSFGKIKGGDALYLKNIFRLCETIKDQAILKRKVLNLITISIACFHIKYAYACTQFSLERNIISLEESNEILSYLNQFVYLPEYLSGKRSSRFFKYRRLFALFLYRLAELVGGGGGFIEKSTPKENRLHPSVLLWCAKKRIPIKRKHDESWINEMYEDLLYSQKFKNEDGAP